MKDKRYFAAAIVRYRYALLALVLLIALLSATQISRTRINYDLNRYLSDDTMTKRALKVMEKEFTSSEQLRLMFTDQTEDSLRAVVETLNARSEVQIAVYDPATDIVKDGTRYQLITLTLDDCDASAFVPELRRMFLSLGDYIVGGSAAAGLDVQNSVGAEMPGVLLIAVIVVLIVLLITSHAWLEPAAILFVLAVSIVINMGTNFIFRDVSFITFAVSAILQLALSIDYAIMLLHTYNACLDEGKNSGEAMTEALSQCFMRVSSSALTTVAGLLSLLFMSFTIGFDIGLVLSKGIVISMLCVFLLMPGTVLLLKTPLKRTRHRPIRLGGEHLGRLIYRARRPVAIVLVLAVLGGAYLNSQNSYTFTEQGSSGQSDTERINALFGSSNPLVVLVPGGTEDEDYEKQRRLADALLTLQRPSGENAITQVTAMVTTGAQALNYYTVEEVAQLTGMSKTAVSLFFALQGFGSSVRADRLLDAAAPLAADNEAVLALKRQLDAARSAFIGPNYDRMLFEPAFQPSDKDFNACMGAVLNLIRAVYADDFYITGIHMSSYDIGNAFNGDLLKVNLITLVAILLIVILSFRSLSLPLLLVFVIEGAIWITMGLSALIREPIFFISYLICLSIQMGATIDYGILLSDQYRSLRQGGLPAREALPMALKKALPTILTSGVILITAGYIIGKRCSIYYISSIGLLISRGALVSALLVMTLLPALLALCDRWILRGSAKARNVSV
ncbi:MAG: MMPL family transporter [Clostridia bacterium]|nr:MMPL family transporter [Clostridia bacterium]